jgi:hypothetical protein
MVGAAAKDLDVAPDITADDIGAALGRSYALLRHLP